MPLDGVSMAYSLAHPRAADRRTTQYFEIFGNRALYRDGWLARTIHFEPWAAKRRAPLDADAWQLFDVRRDFSLARDVAAQYPERLKAMQEAFLDEAVKNHVLPLDDRRLERLNAALVGRPDLMGDRTSLTVYPGIATMSENSFLNVKNRSFAITADLALASDATANGAILAQGGRFGGWSLYLKNGRPIFTYNFLNMQRFTIAAPTALAKGDVKLRFEFSYDGGKLGVGGMGRLLANGKLLAEGRIDRTQAIAFSADDGADVGTDSATPVIEEYGTGGARFTDIIRAVTIDVAPLMEAAPAPASR